MVSPSRRSRLAIAIAAVSLPATFVPAAQAAPEYALEEMVVTAQKRSESAFDVPITLTAYSGDDLAMLGIEEFDRLSDFVPGLVVQEQSVNNPGFVIRGITSDSGSAQIAPRVTLYQDGVDISRSRGSIIELFDLERVEVLKGPQATLFGQSAAIGAISVISARPTDEFEASLSGALGNYDHYRFAGHVSGPLVEGVLRGRLAWVAKEREGFIDNVDGLPGSRNPRAGDAGELNGTDTRAVRGILNWTPSDAFSLDLIVNYQEDTPPGTSFRSGTLPTAFGSVDPNVPAELGPTGIDASAWLGGDLGIDREVWGVTVVGDYTLNDAWALEFTSAYRTFESLEVFDADGTAANWLEFAEDARSEQWSHELRFDYDAGGRLTGFVGASVFVEEGQQAVPFSTDEGVFAACSGGACFLPDGSVNSVSPVPLPYQDLFGNTGEFDIYSLYGDATWAFTDQLSATLGLRYLYEERQTGAFAVGTPSALNALAGVVAPLLPFGDSDGAVVESGTEDFDDFVPRFLLSWTPAETLAVYGSVAKGRRSNVVDSTLDAAGDLDVQILPKEEIWSYETGFKSRLADGRVSLDGSVFYQEYENFQTTVLDQATGLLVATNAGSATNLGVEGAVSAVFSEQLSGYVTVGWIDAEIDDKASNGIFAGNRFRLQPEWTFSAALDFRQPVHRAFDLVATASWTWRDEVFFEIENAPIAGVDIAEDAVSLVALRAGIASTDDRWSLLLRSENLFDEDYIIDAGNTGGVFGSPTLIAGPPRFWSVEASYRF